VEDGKVTDPREENEEAWRVATNKVIAEKLIHQAAELLGSTAKHWTCCDRTTQHEKYVIEYNHETKKK
tara:strand:+ start:52 stop:255 length:204 start_codon:yes stop_codon:yes gene_type:complete